MLDVETQMPHAEQSRLRESVDTFWLPDILMLSLSVPASLPEPVFIQKPINGKNSSLTQEMMMGHSKQGGISVLEDSQELDSQQKQCYES